MSDKDSPPLLCCSADYVTLSEPAKAKAGRPCKAPGPPAGRSGTLSEGKKKTNKSESCLGSKGETQENSAVHSLKTPFVQKSYVYSPSFSKNHHVISSVVC